MEWVKADVPVDGAINEWRASCGGIVREYDIPPNEGRFRAFVHGRINPGIGGRGGYLGLKCLRWCETLEAAKSAVEVERARARERIASRANLNRARVRRNRLRGSARRY